MRIPFVHRKRKRMVYGNQPQVFVRPTDVPGIFYRGGRGVQQQPRIGPNLKHGLMTGQAIKLGYIKEGQKISDIPKSKMGDFAIDLAKQVGPGHATRMFNAQVVLRKHEGGGLKDRMVIAKSTLKQQSRTIKVKR